MALPFSPELKTDDQQYVVDTLRRFFEEATSGD